jgi:hypothetical protein
MVEKRRRMMVDWARFLATATVTSIKDDHGEEI